MEERPGADEYWSLPVVAETYDGALNDINGQHVGPEHVREALQNAAAGPVVEGSVGGGTGMICHEFKGGIGTASRCVPDEQGGWTVGALVQANYGSRATLRVDGLPVGRVISKEQVPSPFDEEETEQPPGTGSIIVILATDAPLLPIQCDRLVQRATVGLARMGGGLDNGSGDIFLAFATGNRGLSSAVLEGGVPQTVPVRMLPNERMTPLFHAAAEATEAAILNALLSATTVTGRDGVTAHGLEPDVLLSAMEEVRAGSRS
jgi:D-aminopeptidase